MTGTGRRHPSLRRAGILAFGMLMGSGGVQAQSVFYSNTDMSTTFNSVVGSSFNAEIIDDIPFTGTIRVDRFVIGYNLSRRTPVQDRNIDVRFYEPDPVTGYAQSTPVAQFLLNNVNVGRFDTEDIDLAAMGQSFLWTAGTTFGGEQGGMLGLQFDPLTSGSWYFADGGGSSNIYEQRNYFSGSGLPLTTISGDGLYQYFFGPGVPLEGSFYAVLYGEAVPEPGSIALLVGLSLSGAGLLRRRRQASRSV